MNDAVNHPAHYTDGKYEVIEFIENWGLGFHLGNAVKYISRAGKKEPDKTIQDLEKAIWYINRAQKYGKNTMSVCNHIWVIEYCNDKKLPDFLKCAMLHLIAGNFKMAVEEIESYINHLRYDSKEGV